MYVCIYNAAVHYVMEYLASVLKTIWQLLPAVRKLLQCRRVRN